MNKKEDKELEMPVPANDQWHIYCNERMGQSHISPQQSRKMRGFRFRPCFPFKCPNKINIFGIPCFQKTLHQIRFLIIVFWHWFDTAELWHWSCFFKVIRCLREGLFTGLRCFDVVCSYIYMFMHVWHAYTISAEIIKNAALWYLLC